MVAETVNAPRQRSPSLATNAHLQNQAREFVLEHFKNTYTNQARHLHIPTSLALAGLEAAYIKEHMRVCPNGRMIPTAGFTLSQVYAAYYAAINAETAISVMV